jgi:hypothetical protein
MYGAPFLQSALQDLRYADLQERFRELKAEGKDDETGLR